MRLVVRIIGLLVVLVVAVFGLSMLASESGEVVVVTTKSATGTPHETRVWVVDDAGQQWIRAGNPKSTWLLAIERDPTVTVQRAGKRAPYTAVPDRESRERINALFAAKYGWADALIGTLFGHQDATPIRLVPATS